MSPDERTPDTPPSEMQDVPDRSQAAPAGEMATMPFLRHLEELRRTLIRMLAVTVVGAVGAWFVAEPILDLLVTRIWARCTTSDPPRVFSSASRWRS